MQLHFAYRLFCVVCLSSWVSLSYFAHHYFSFAYRLSFFLHNCVQPIVKNANPATRRTDIVIAYTITAVLYASVGAIGYLGFADARTPAECAAPESCILRSNFLGEFGTTLSNFFDIYAFTARATLLLQLVTVYPLLLLIVRTQAFGLLAGSAYPSYLKVALLNGAMMGITFAFAALDLQISAVLSYTGAIGGLVIIVLIPVAIDISVRRKAGTMSPLRWALHGFIALLGFAVFALQFIPIT